MTVSMSEVQGTESSLGTAQTHKMLIFTNGLIWLWNFSPESRVTPYSYFYICGHPGAIVVTLEWPLLVTVSRKRRGNQTSQWSFVCYFKELYQIFSLLDFREQKCYGRNSCVCCSTSPCLLDGPRSHANQCQSPLPPCHQSHSPLFLLLKPCQQTTNSSERTPLDANDDVAC